MATTPSEHPPLAIVMPLANEAHSIEALLTEILAYLSPHDSILCVVDHASTDTTRTIIDALSLKDSRIQCIWAPDNTCVVDAYFAGYRAALKTSAQWILEMDAGFSHQPKDIPPFLSAMTEGYDFVGGSRFLPGGHHHGSLFRRLWSQLGGTASSVLLQTRMTDMTSGFECFTREALQFIVNKGVHSKAHFFQTEIRYWMHQFHWTELPITYASNNTTVSPTSIVDSVCACMALWWQHRFSSS